MQISVSNLLVLLAATLISAQFLNQSAPFELVVLSTIATINGF